MCTSRKSSDPIEKVVEEYVEQIVENNVYRDEVIEVDIRDVGRYQADQVLPTRKTQQYQERIVEQPEYIENIIRKRVEVPVERIVERRVEETAQVVERIMEKPVYIENIVERVVEVPVGDVIERRVERVIEKPVPVERIVEREVAVEIPRERIVEVPVDEIIEQAILHGEHNPAADRADRGGEGVRGPGGQRAQERIVEKRVPVRRSWRGSTRT